MIPIGPSSSPPPPDETKGRQLASGASACNDRIGPRGAHIRLSVCLSVCRSVGRSIPLSPLESNKLAMKDPPSVPWPCLATCLQSSH